MKQIIIVCMLALGMAGIGVSEVRAQEVDQDITLETRSDAEIREQIQWIINHLQIVIAQLEQEADIKSKFFVVKIDKDTVVNTYTKHISREAAQEECEMYAYHPINMWRLITCTYEDEVMYRDVFIAG